MEISMPRTLNAKSLGWTLATAVAAVACSAAPAGRGEGVAAQSAALSTAGSFIVLYGEYRVPRTVASDIASAGGALVASYPEIGVVIATADSPSFASTMATLPGVEGVGTTTGQTPGALPTKLPDRKLPRPTLPPPSGDGEPLAPMQWDMDQIHAPQARAIEPGRKSVVVGVLDSGIDDTVVDLQGQVDHARSATCIGGVANPDPAAWSHDGIGHGTHVAGLIGAAINGKGIAGVAPGVTLAAVKVTDDGFIYPEAFICAMAWAAAHDFDLVNASLFTDPWYYTCPDDPDQRVILIAEQRAVTYARLKGVTVIAAASNENQDLANPTTDPFSPTNGTSLNRTVTSACKLLPVELDGVVAVSAVGGDGNLAYYSNYGAGVIDLTAPGGDLHVAVAGDPSGQIVSDVPSYSFYYQIAYLWNGRIGIGCTDGLDPNDPAADPSTCKETYALLQGTSQATPHVTGAAALALSRFGKMSSDVLVRRLTRSATQRACPGNPYQPYPADMPSETCVGPASDNSFYGAGEVDALGVLDPRN
jgi:subtilisin family serine protease